MLLEKKKPIWFCGTAKEWDFVTRASLQEGSPSMLKGMSEPYFKSESLWSWSSYSEITQLTSVVSGLVGWGVGTAQLMSNFSTMPILVAVALGGVGGFTCSFAGRIPGGILAAVTRKFVIPLRNTMKGAALPTLLTEVGEMGEGRIQEIIDVTEAGRSVAEEKSLLEDKMQMSYVINGLKSILNENDRVRGERVKEEANSPEAKRRDREELALAMRKAMPEAFRDEGRKDSTTKAILEGKLSSLGDIGADGLAAVMVWKGLGNLNIREESERDIWMEDRLPRLVEAFTAVPEQERDRPNEALDGETPRGSLKRGLGAALDAALEARRRLAERASVGVEAQARVMEEARGQTQATLKRNI